MKTIKTITGAFGTVTLLLWGMGWQAQQATAQQQAQPTTAQQQNQQEGVEVLARGPVHEAFAEPTMRRQGTSPVVPKKPPDPINELAPEQKPEGDDMQWIPGYWAWDDSRSDFLWVSGI